MWVWRAFIFSLSIALFAAISFPARALESSPQFHDAATNTSVAFQSADDSSNIAKLAPLSKIQQSQKGSTEIVLATQKIKLKELADNEKQADKLEPKVPPYHSRFNHDIRWPAFERHGHNAFSSVVQSEPTFVLAYEFLPEILGLKHFLAPLNTNAAVPWYLRPDAASNHSRLTGWKDGNTLYTGTITYLS